MRHALPVALSAVLLAGCSDRPKPARPRAAPPLAAEAARREPAPPREGRFSPAAVAEHVEAVKKRAPRGFSVVASPPFVVIGDQPPAVVQRTTERLVEWAVEKLRRDFFDAEPKEILDVWLFKDAESYERHTRALFGVRPTTPYGFYSAEHKALIMNIATGGGTLVHEIVHPYVEADFPEAPPWLNEGLGSLFEASEESEGHITGIPNWRLPALQEAIRDGRVPPFRELLGKSAQGFYDEDRGTNYAEARYLCYYLQEQGLLVRFYKELRAGHAADPTGYQTLQRVLGESDMTAFQKRWETFVLGLSYRR